MKPPNILLIHSDQHRFDCLGVHGHPQVQTPHLDRLAREGVDFTRAFTPCPICSPARASLLTGAWPTAHGCIDIPTTEAGQPARSEYRNLWELLGRKGYQLGMVGKFHGEVPGSPPDYGVDDFVPKAAYFQWRDE